MRKFTPLALVLAAVLGLALTPSVAWARPSNIYSLYLLVFGEPAAVGVLASGAGANITNATTAASFVLTAVGARVVSVQCDATAFVGFTATCGITLATSAGCVRLAATDAPRIFVLQDGTTAMNAAGPAAFNCIVAKYF